MGALPRIRLVTNYRLLVSAAAMAFGMAKATLCYLDLSNEATAVEWIFGVVVSTTLYVIGLYEYNPSKRLRILFDRDDSASAIFVSYEVLSIGAMANGIIIRLFAFVSGALRSMQTPHHPTPTNHDLTGTGNSLLAELDHDQLYDSYFSEQSHPQQNAAKTRWHPKLTPFRVLTMIVGVGLGISKAVLSYKGMELAPIALEWILGTLLFIIIYFLDVLNHETHLNDDSYHWFYDYDCTTLLWTILKQFGAKVPEYSTSEEVVWTPYYMRTVVTNYRLLVSATVLVFGTLKAVLSFLDRSDGATTVDWIFGVIVGTSLYILGLYEHNTANIFPSLFTRNDSRLLFFVVYEGFFILSSTALTYMFVLGSRFSRDTLSQTWPSYRNDTDLSSMEGISTLFGGIIMILALCIFMYFSFLALVLAVVIMARYFEPSGVMHRLFVFIAQRFNSRRFVSGFNVPTQAFTQRASNQALYYPRTLRCDDESTNTGTLLTLHSPQRPKKTPKDLPITGIPGSTQDAPGAAAQSQTWSWIWRERRFVGYTYGLGGMSVVDHDV
ncbi:hypothetical protein CVT24_002787 [Panaeolus cyanescens]|uniref:Uncharacterized protein n=1 Tax=Panaeolus cyanescens TaxID=181874 RepID=A0A409YRE6_9AGAR|nr:hypothetical protein CVT24_002787 [Panaeolus cyanescens]